MIFEYRAGVSVGRGAEMSKIPQGEWNAIAARYEKGESISGIARGYGCTPPAIHYILKRHRQLPATAVRPLTPARPAGAAAAAPVPAYAPEPAPPGRMAGKSEHDAQSPVLVRASPPLAAASSPPAGKPDQRPAAPPPTPGLDSELHTRAEAAIAMFRSSFDAALMEGSPDVRERLRQAAADLMRVAARTTIVLDRVTAGSERPDRGQNYPRSAHAGDGFRKSGSV
jgi:transposase-like protein